MYCKSTKSKGVHEQDKGLLLAPRETQQATQPNESNGDATCPIGSLMGAVGTSRKSSPKSSPSSVPQSLGDVSLLTLQTWDLEQLGASKYVECKPFLSQGCHIPPNNL